MWSNKPTHYIRLFLVTICFVAGAGREVCGQDSLKTGIDKLISSVEQFNNNHLAEKLYIHTDKPYYYSGDTLWLKAYLLDGRYLQASSGSGILYVEIANDSNSVIHRMMLPVYSGLTFSQIVLDEKLFPEGAYVLRGYTNWMRNFTDEKVFEKQFYIGNATENKWLVNYRSVPDKENEREKATLNLRINRVDNAPVGLREVQVRVQNSGRTLLKRNVETTVDGLLDISFDLPEKTEKHNIFLTIRDLRKGEENRIIKLPIALNSPGKIDLQFMPEGGNLVAGLPVTVGFKALREDGLGAEVSGIVYNSKSEEVVRVSSSNRGMGRFRFVPEAGENYVLKLPLPGSSFKVYPLPAVKISGTLLQVSNEFQSDTCEVIVRATPDIAEAGRMFFLTGQSKGMICFAASFVLKGQVAKFKVDKKLFPSGIARFTLSGPGHLALNERIVFIDHHDYLRFQIDADKKVYRQRDNISLLVKVTREDGNPVQGSFSLAVTDDGQVKTDSIKDLSIRSYMLLASCLRGNIEDPGYYFASEMTLKKWKDLDNLLLTQGWTGYEWGDIFRPLKSFSFAAEPEFSVKGRVSNIFNKPVANTEVLLMSKKPLLVMDTLTNDHGDFTFKGIFPADTAIFFIQARNKRGKSFNVGIEVDEFIPPGFSAKIPQPVPWFVNTDTSGLMRIRRLVQLKNDQTRITRGNLLKEVTITGKKIITNSKNLNGPGEADVIIDEKELEKSGRTTLADLLARNVKGFGIRADKTGKLSYRINSMLVHLIIDGINTEFFLPDGMSLYEYLKQYFDYYDAEEIKGIEVMTSGKYQMRYSSYYLDPMVTPWDHTFIEVTTRGGKGPFVKKSTGTYLYRPMPFTLPKKFYAPEYMPGSVPDMTDIRSVVHWVPNLVTDKNGEVRISFYSTDNTGSYSVIIEGSDMLGGLGAARSKIMVEK